MTTSPENAPTIRDKIVSDLPALADLWVASWQVTMPHLDFEARRPWFVERMAEHDAQGARTLVAIANGAIAGFVVIHPATGYLDQIAVAPQDRGGGIAAALLDAAKHVRPDGIDLHVNQDNERAIGFYWKHGFKITGEDVNPRSGAPIYRMSWRG